MVGSAGALLPPARLFFPFAVSSRLILIIGIQSSSKPNPPLLPVGPHSAPPVRLRGPPLGVPLAGMDSTIRPAWKIPAVMLPPDPALSLIRRPDKSSRCARLLRWPG